MSYTYDVAFVNQFKDNFYHLQQQGEAKLASADRIRIETLTGEYGYFEQIGADDNFAEVSTNNADTTITDSDFQRRRCEGAYYAVAKLIDEKDQVQMLINPTSAMTQSLAMSANRKLDSLVNTAFNAAAAAGKAGATSTSFDSNYLITSSGTNSGDTGGMNKAKLLYAKYLLDNGNVPESDRWLAIGPQQAQDLLNVTEVASADYNSVKALVEGQITHWLGFNIVMTTGLTKTLDTRACFAWHKNSMLLAKQLDVMTKISERDDKHFSTQVYVRFMAGATRMDEKGVVQINCVET